MCAAAAGAVVAGHHGGEAHHLRPSLAAQAVLPGRQLGAEHHCAHEEDGQHGGQQADGDEALADHAARAAGACRDPGLRGGRPVF